MIHITIEDYQFVKLLGKFEKENADKIAMIIIGDMVFHRKSSVGSEHYRSYYRQVSEDL